MHLKCENCTGLDVAVDGEVAVFRLPHKEHGGVINCVTTARSFTLMCPHFLL